MDIHRIGLWGASAGANLAAALALKYSRQQTTSNRPKLCFASFVVPVTATPQVFNSFEKNRPFPRSHTELLFEGAPEPTEANLQEFNTLYGELLSP